MYLTMELEIDEQIITPKRGGILKRLFTTKTETTGEDVKESDEVVEQSGQE